MLISTHNFILIGRLVVMGRKINYTIEAEVPIPVCSLLKIKVFFLSCFFGADSPNGLGGWLSKSLWFIVFHQFLGCSRVHCTRSTLRSFPCDAALVLVSQHSSPNLLCCNVVSITSYCVCLLVHIRIIRLLFFITNKFLIYICIFILLYLLVVNFLVPNYRD